MSLAPESPQVESEALPLARFVDGLPVEVVTGQLLWVGLAGTTPQAEELAAFSRGHRGGAILFRRNVRVEAGLVVKAQVAEWNAAIAQACPAGLPPVLAVDQEGGRVARLRSPFRAVLPMRSFENSSASEVEAMGYEVARELAEVHFNLCFAPVLDVDSNPANPIIGDRAFGSDPEVVGRLGNALLRGFRRAGILGCGKHFPGHGDTALDSHLELPRVSHGRERLEAIEFAPFRSAISEGLEVVMTAHIVFDALDPEKPATLSSSVLQGLLRETLQFRGLCVSDDLLMRGVSPRAEADPDHVAEVALRAISAGCDALLICEFAHVAQRVHERLLEKASADAAFLSRCRDALVRALALRASPKGRALGRP